MAVVNYKVIMESKGTKFCFYYDNSAIYCKTVDFDGKAKESILIESVYDNFLYAKSQSDSIYLLCQGHNKNYLLFTYDGEGWHTEELFLKREFGNIIPLGLFALTDGIHVIFAKRLSLEHYYDLHQLRKSKDAWEKNFICQIYSKKIKSFLDIKMTGYNMLHMVTILFNGEISSLYYHNYDAKSAQWVNTSIVNLSQNNIYIKILAYENNLHLFCYSFDTDAASLFYFTKAMSKNSNFSLVDIVKIDSISKGSDIVPDVDDTILKICYISNERYYEKHYDISKKKWISEKDMPLKDFPNLNYAKILIDSYDMNLIEKEVICLVGEKLEIKKPLDERNMAKENSTAGDDVASRTATLLLEQINMLTEKLESLDKKINKLEGREFNKEIQHKKSPPPVLKESNFKEKFMKSKPASLKLDGNPVIMQPFSDAEEGKEKKEGIPEESTEKAPEEVIEKVTEEVAQIKPKGIIKTFSEFFK